MKCERIRRGTKSGDDTPTDRGYEGAVTKFFPGVNVGEVDFEGGLAGCGNGVA